MTTKLAGTKFRLSRDFSVSNESVVASRDSVRRFGATGDGVTNDRDALRTALSASSATGLYIPSGTYRIDLESGTGLGTLPSGITIAGDGASTVLDIRTSSTSYLNALTVGGDNITLRDLSIVFTLQASQTATMFLLSGSRSNFRVQNCSLSSSYSGTNSTHFSYLFNTTTSAADVMDGMWVGGCVIRGWYYTFLKTNAAQRADRRYFIIGNRFADNGTAHVSLNSPAGVFDQVVIQDNTFGDLIHGTAGVVHSVGLASITNCVVASNVFSGVTAGDAIHIEEACANVAVTGNVITVGEKTDQTTWGDGIRLLDNNIGNPLAAKIAPRGVTITGNTVARSGTLGGTGIAVTYDASDIPGAADTVIAANVVTGFARGIESDSKSKSVRIESNIVKGCTVGLFLPDTGGAQITDNTVNGCTTGVEGLGLIARQHFVGATTPVNASADGHMAACGWSVTQEDLTIDASGYTDFDLMPAGLRMDGTLRFLVRGTSANTNVLSASVTLGYDGSTLTETLLNKHAPGSLDYTSVTVASGMIRLRIYSAAGAAMTPARLWAEFDGLHVCT